MSRVGKMPIAVPQGVEVTDHGRPDHRQGPARHAVAHARTRWSRSTNEGGKLMFAPANDIARSQRHARHDARAGRTTWCSGVTKGFEKKLTLVGVGYRAAGRRATR